MDNDILQEILQRLTKIESVLDESKNSRRLELENLEEKIRVINHRISDIEDSNKWLWRTTVAAVISCAFAILSKFI